MRDCLFVISLVLLAGCPDLVSVDDPRTIEGSGDTSGDGGVHERGRCDGTAWHCDDRSQAQCNSGCTIAPACRSPVLDRCASHREEAACSSDS
jgi:hypothetical protein